MDVHLRHPNISQKRRQINELRIIYSTRFQARHGTETRGGHLSAERDLTVPIGVVDFFDTRAISSDRVIHVPGDQAGRVVSTSAGFSFRVFRSVMVCRVDGKGHVTRLSGQTVPMLSTCPKSSK
jgi:hypothetical protein